MQRDKQKEESIQLSHAMEDYLRTIYRLQEQNKKVTTSALAKRLKVAPASVTKMLKKFASLELVIHQPYRGVTLTPKGHSISLELVRHHRLLELFLVEVVGVPWDRVHEEAHRLEHALSEYLEDRLASLLNDPKFDPHGQPIPSKDGTVVERDLQKLSQLPIGTRGVVAQIEDNDSELLRYVARHGLYPKTSLELIERDSFDCGVSVRVNDGVALISVKAADQIWIEPDFIPDDES